MRQKKTIIPERKVIFSMALRGMTFQKLTELAEQNQKTVEAFILDVLEDEAKKLYNDNV